MNLSLPNRAIEWRGQTLYLLDQRRLPSEIVFVECTCCEAVAQAIREMVVRGAPAIGIAAAYGVVLSVMRHTDVPADQWRGDIQYDMERLMQARPTAINLVWSVKKMMQGLEQATPGDAVEKAKTLAFEIHAEDIRANQHMGQLGAEWIPENTQVMTHCNAGALATGGYGTALGVVRAAHQQHKITNVFVNETRPWFQGSRLTAWELMQEHIPVTVTCDSAAATLLRGGSISWVIVGADRIAANGDVANKIGTYNLAVNAHFHGLRFMVVAPTSTIDLHTASGAEIPIEVRDATEIIQCHGVNIGTAETSAYNPVFDITPAHLVDVLVTEKGAIERPDTVKIARLFA